MEASIQFQSIQLGLGGIVVRNLTDLVGCISQGDTLEEAIANIQEAKIAWMETAWEYGDEISLPSQF